MLTNNVFAYDSAGRDRLTEAALSKGDGRAEWARASQQQNGTNYFYLRDHLGSVREMVNASGSIVAEATYDPYGVATVKGSVTPTFQYAGYYAHQGSGLNLTWYRAYDPVIGRWQARDPLPNAERSQGMNLYEYVKNDPIDKIDSDGRFAFIPVVVICVAAKKLIDKASDITLAALAMQQLAAQEAACNQALARANCHYGGNLPVEIQQSFKDWKADIWNNARESTATIMTHAPGLIYTGPASGASPR